MLKPDNKESFRYRQRKCNHLEVSLAFADEQSLTLSYSSFCRLWNVHWLLLWCTTPFLRWDPMLLLHCLVGNMV